MFGWKKIFGQGGRYNQIKIVIYATDVIKLYEICFAMIFIGLIK